jgi:hypothetical protein
VTAWRTLVKVHSTSSPEASVTLPPLDGIAAPAPASARHSSVES